MVPAAASATVPLEPASLEAGVVESVVPESVAPMLRTPDSLSHQPLVAAVAASGSPAPRFIPGPARPRAGEHSREPAIEQETLALLEWPRLAEHLASFASTGATNGSKDDSDLPRGSGEAEGDGQDPSGSEAAHAEGDPGALGTAA